MLFPNDMENPAAFYSSTLIQNKASSITNTVNHFLTGQNISDQLFYEQLPI